MKPRAVLPGCYYQITRRCSERRFFMVPSKELNNAFIYCLCRAAKKCGIEVIYVKAMSNHYHIGIYDPKGKYPRFLHWFHAMFARCMNAYRRRCEAFWDRRQTSAVRLESPEDILDKMVYALTNSVKDHLVEKAHHWVGASSYEATLSGGSLKATRPAHFFRKGANVPDEVTLPLQRPQGFEHLSQQEFATLLTNKVTEVEKAAAQERKRSGTRVLGVKAVLEQDWRAAPKTREPRRQLNPSVAAKNRWRRVEALLRNAAFLKAYKAAREMLLAGVRDVVFPAGTYWLKHFAGVTCAPNTT